jgi:hypothetical protein
LVDTKKVIDVDSTALPSGASIADTVAAHLEPVTRFNADDISQDAPDQAISVSAMLTHVQAASFELAWLAGPRHLPKHITRLGNGTALKVELNRQLLQARAECDDALRTWVAQSPHAYRRILPADAVFRQPPGSFGIEFTCQSCYGKCQVACTTCTGGGQVACTLCEGSGTTMCNKCAGTTRLKCLSCNGSGHTTEQVNEQRWDPASNAYVTYRAPVNRPCLTCSGAGERHCTSCVFGQAQCVACSGKRTVSCATCDGAGCFSCKACEATGVQHEWATVAATVSSEQELTFGKVDLALELLIRERIAVQDLPSYGAFLEAHHIADQMALGSRYELRIDAIYARLHAATRHFSIYALGPDAQVFDFVNIAGHLLEDDLVTLEQALAPVSVWSRQHDAALRNALKLFVASELNLLIAEQAGGQHSDAQLAAASVEKHFRNMVDAAYVQRAGVALREGFDALYSANLVRPALWIAGGAGLLAALVYTFGPAHYGVLKCMGWALAGSALAWAGAEMLALHRIMRFFPEHIGARLHSQVKASGGVKRWRLGLGAGLLATTFLGVTLASSIAFLRHRHEGRPAVAEQAPPDESAWSIEKDRSTADKEGLYEIQQQARQFVVAHNKKHKTSFRVLEPNLKAQFPKCKVPMTMAWVPKSYGLSSPSVFVRCKKSVSKYERKWEAIVPVAKTGG